MKKKNRKNIFPHLLEALIGPVTCPRPYHCLNIDECSFVCSHEGKVMIVYGLVGSQKVLHEFRTGWAQFTNKQWMCARTLRLFAYTNKSG